MTFRNIVVNIGKDQWHLWSSMSVLTRPMTFRNIIVNIRKDQSHLWISMSILARTNDNSQYTCQDWQWPMTFVNIDVNSNKDQWHFAMVVNTCNGQWHLWIPMSTVTKANDILCWFFLFRLLVFDRNTNISKDEFQFSSRSNKTGQTPHGGSTDAARINTCRGSASPSSYENINK